MFGALPPVLSNESFRYYIIFIDAFSRFTWIYPMHTKDEALPIFMMFSKHVENLFNTKIKFFQSDNGGEYRKFTKVLQQNGTHHRFTCPHTSAQNGLVERRHRHIVETGLTLLSMATVPPSFWYDAFSTACFLMNRIPSSPTGIKSPYELLFNKTPDYISLRTFGCLCFPHLRAYNSNKLQPRSSACVFLGYDSSRKGYKCYHIPTKRVYWSRHVVFVEESFPFAAASAVLPSPLLPTQVTTTSHNFSSAPSTTPNVSSNPLNSFRSALVPAHQKQLFLNLPPLNPQAHIFLPLPPNQIHYLLPLPSPLAPRHL